jgi:hypothetical protein
MRNAGLSVLLFGAYLIAVGASLLLVPNLLLGIFGIPHTDEVWIRILGAVMVALGYLYVKGGRSATGWFLRASVLTRAGVATVLLVLVLIGEAASAVALFGFVDFGAAAWTAYALDWMSMRRGATR